MLSPCNLSRIQASLAISAMPGGLAPVLWSLVRAALPAVAAPTNSVPNPCVKRCPVTG